MAGSTAGADHALQHGAPGEVHQGHDDGSVRRIRFRTGGPLLDGASRSTSSSPQYKLGTSTGFTACGPPGRPRRVVSTETSPTRRPDCCCGRWGGGSPPPAAHRPAAPSSGAVGDDSPAALTPPPLRPRQRAGGGPAPLSPVRGSLLAPSLTRPRPRRHRSRSSSRGRASSCCAHHSGPGNSPGPMTMRRVGSCCT